MEQQIEDIIFEMNLANNERVHIQDSRSLMRRITEDTEERAGKTLTLSMDFKKSDLLDSKISVIALNDFMKRRAGLESLHLMLSGFSKADIVTLISNLHYPQLRIFSTSLPHRHVSEFIDRHVTLREVELQTKHGCQLNPKGAMRQVQSLVAPELSLSSFTKHNPLRSIQVTTPVEKKAVFVRILREVRTTLTDLTVHFVIRDEVFLHRVCRAVPNLQRLTLIETPSLFSTSRNKPRFAPWNNRTNWRDVLRLFAELKYFKLVTRARVVNPVGNERAELRLLSAWFPQPPLMLHEVVLEYGRGREVDSWWNYSTAGWNRV